jgi:hypothetical protein
MHLQYIMSGKNTQIDSHHMCPAEGIGRAFATHIGEQWWGIGRHWRAFVTKMNNKLHIALYNPFPNQHTKRNGTQQETHFIMPHMCPLERLKSWVI